MTLRTFARSLCNALVLVLGFALAWFLVLLWLTDASAEPPGPRAGPAPCSHYASGQGQGSACSESQPCAVQTWLTSQAGPGKVLCLMDGHYTGEQSMLTLTSVNGTEGQPITIRALNDGKAEIDGQFGARPLDCNGAWLTVQGVNLRDGNDTVGAIRGQHCTIQRVVAWSTQSWDGIDNVFDIGGSHNLLEDCGAFGYARKMVAVGARAGNGPNTVRRCWAEFNGSMPGSVEGNPTHSFEMGYDQDNVTFENVLFTRDVLSASTQPEAPMAIFSTRGSALLGSIGYAKAGQTWDVDLALTVWPEGGSHAGSGHVTSQTLIKDLVLLVSPTFPGGKGFYVQGGSGSSGNTLTNVVTVAPLPSGCQGSGWDCTQIRQGTTLAQATGGQSVFTLVPGVCTRYVNRTLTTEPLWPWPMQARIEAARGAAKMPARNVTRSVEEVLGAIPSQCKSGGTPPPEPGPTPTPGPHPALACEGTITGVPGTVSMNCVPQEGRR